MGGTKPSYEIMMAVFDVADHDLFLHLLRTIARKYTTTIICFDADRMVGRQHAEAAIRHALRSFSGGYPIANTFEMEALLFAAGTRQCSLASAFGAHTGANRVYVCCSPPREGIWQALSSLMRIVHEDWEGINADKRTQLKNTFSITDGEIAAVGESRLADLVLERVALLEVYR